MFDLLVTARGLWVGSDTDRIGHNEYHARLALPSQDDRAAPGTVRVASLPGSVHLLGRG